MTSSVHLPADEVENVLLVAAAVLADYSNDSGMAAWDSVIAEGLVVAVAAFVVGNVHPVGHSAADGVDDDAPYP